jgi:hypothetical protein
VPIASLLIAERVRREGIIYCINNIIFFLPKEPALSAVSLFFLFRALLIPLLFF